MKLRPRAGRFLLGAIGFIGVAGLAIDVIDGRFAFRGHVTSLAENPGKFWVSIFIFGALFAGLLLWAISGWRLERSPSRSTSDEI
ncbi:hypothetical protein [Sphingopyxis sp. GW247-27LB]|uniref:hypothetical protein n=1 Tax=Sphingopyxis sp. GW247-27LB TaxID=2012632 RepID=UPI001140AC22|nr:hypothetical protein [Sphingopyxis sp. GW247-27LB]